MYVYIHAHTHTHTHTYIYIYIDRQLGAGPARTTRSCSRRADYRGPSRACSWREFYAAIPRAAFSPVFRTFLYTEAYVTYSVNRAQQSALF